MILTRVLVYILNFLSEILIAFDLKEGSSEPQFLRGNKYLYFHPFHFSLKGPLHFPLEEEHNLSNMIC